MESHANTSAFAPIFEKPPEIDNIVEGQSVLLRCKIRAQPAPTVRWIRNGRVLSQTNKYLLSNNPETGIYSLTIFDFSIADDGEYICIASNIVGESSIIAVIEKGAKNLAAKQFDSSKQLHEYQLNKRLLGQKQVHVSNTNFICEEFENKLFKDIDFRNSLLTNFPDDQPYNRNALQSDDGTQSAPEIVQKPKNIFCYEGDDLTFQTKVSGNPIPRIYWFKNGKPLKPTQRCAIEYENGVVYLRIHMLLPEDAASYTLLTENNFGLAIFSIKLSINYVGDENIPPQQQQQESIRRTTTATTVTSSNQHFASDDIITTSGIKPHFYLIPYDMEALQGQIVRFECRVSGRPEPEVLWYRNEKRIFDCEHYKCVVNEEGNYALLIMGVDTQDTATYRSVASNAIGEASFTVSLNVIERERMIAPKFVESFQNTNAREGDSVTLHCRSEGKPTPQLKWQKDGLQIESNPPNHEIKAEEGASSLLINSCTTRDAGWYQCTAQNQAGSVATRARLNVESTYQPPRGEPLKLVFPKTHRRIEPECEQYETVTLRHVQKVYERYSSIDYDQNLDIEQHRAQQQQQASSSALQRQPLFSTHLRDVEIVQGDHAHFEAYLSLFDYSGLVVEWYLNERLLETGDSRVITTYRYGYIALTLLNVEPFDSGIVTCKVRNQHGEAVTSAKLKCAKDTKAPATEPKVGLPPEYIQKYENVEDSEFYRHQREIEEERRTKMAPKFIQPLEANIIVQTGYRVMMLARLLPITDPNLRIEWFFNGKPLIFTGGRMSSAHNFGQVSLSISNVVTSDAGHYVVKAINNSGETESATSVKVVLPDEPKKHKAAEISIQDDTMMHTKVRRHEMQEDVFLSSVSQQEGFQSIHTIKPFFRRHFPSYQQAETRSTVRMEAFIEPKDDPTMEIFLLKDNCDISSMSKINILFNCGYISICIRDLTLEDAGQYKCIARNQVGSCETNLDLKIVPDQMLERFQPSKSVVHEEIFRRETSSTFKKQDQTAAPELSAQIAPVFRIPLHIPPLLYSEGENIYMEAFIEPVADPALQIEWFHNGQPLRADLRYRSYFDFGRLSLTINDAKLDDSGEYTVVVRNQVGQADSNSTVTIIKLESGVQYRPSLQPATTVEDFSLIESQETIERKRQIEQHDRLEVRQHQQQLPQQPIIDSEFNRKPCFVSKFNNIRVEEGKTACLESRIEPSTDSNLVIDWFFEGQPLKVGNRFQPYFHFGYVVLKILKTQPDDSGTYTCRISNQLGYDEMSASIICFEQIEEYEERIIEHAHTSVKCDDSELSVKPQAPRFASNLKDVEVIEGEKVHFECFLKTNDDPDLVVEWYKESHLLQKGSRFVEICDFGYVCLDILYAYPEDSGVYTVKARNTYGEDSRRCVLHCRGTACLDTRSQNEISVESIRKLETKRERRKLEEPPTQEAPKFLQPLKSAKRNEREFVHFETRLVPIGDEHLTVEWLHNSYPLQCSSRITTIFNFGYVALSIKDLQASDSGTYVCRAVNTNGEATISAPLEVVSTDIIVRGSAFPESLEKISAIESKTVKRKEFEDEIIGTTAPLFVTQLKGSKQLDEGMAAHFECMIEPTRDETMTVEWFHNGKPLSIGSRYRPFFDFGYVALDIFKITPEDSGEYLVRIKNHLGFAESKINLLVTGKESILSASNQPSSLDKIQVLERTHKKKKVDEEFVIIDKPQFKGSFKDFVIKEGDPLHFETTLSPVNDPSMNIEWFLNGQLLKVGHRFKSFHDFGFVALDILYAYPEDSGTYECRATNDLGTASLVSNIKVIERKTIDTSTIHDESLAQIRHLERTHVITRETEVYATSQPRFERQLRADYELKEGESVLLECILQPVNDPSMEIEWLHNSRPIPSGHRFVTVNEFSYVALKILYAYPEDSGTYMIKATNQVGEAISSCNLNIIGKRNIITDTINPQGLEKIQVLEKSSIRTKTEYEYYDTKPPRFLSKLRGTVRLIEGETAHIECQIEPVNDPDLVVEILHNGQPLKTGSRFRTLSDFGYIALDIGAIYPEDSGIYTIKVSNRFGEVRDSIQIDVQPIKAIQTDTQYAETLDKLSALERGRRYVRPQVDDRTMQRPVFTKALHNIYNLREGDHAHLECRLIPVGDPVLKVEWFKDGRPLPMANRYGLINDFGFVSLDIRKVESKDAGTYSVRASNELGEAQTTCTLHVSAEECIITGTTNVESLQTIQYLEKSRIRRVVDQESGSRCEKPNFVTSLRGPNEVNENERICLECRVSPLGDSSMTYTWLKNGKELASSNRIATSNDFGYIVLDIASATPEDSGIYMIRVANDFGEAISSHQLRVNTFSNIDQQCQHPEAYRHMQQLEMNKMRKRTEPEPRFDGPRFARHLSSSNVVNEGDAVHVEAIIEPREDESLVIEWYKNGNFLILGSRITTYSDFGRIVLDILNCKPEDSGVYICRAINKNGEATSSCTVKVNSEARIDTSSLFPETLGTLQQLDVTSTKQTDASDLAPIVSQVVPYFQTHIQNVETIEGENIAFECTVAPSNDQTLQFEILHNEKEITASNRILISCEFGYVRICINCVEPKDEGIYCIKVYNDAGASMSSGSLKVRPVHEIQEATMHPRGAEGLKAIQKIDKIQSKVRVLNEQQPGFEFPAPKFVKPLLGQLHTNENDEVMFECQVVPFNDPNLKIEWFFNGQTLPSSSRITQTESLGHIKLFIRDLMLKDSGVYKCRATNGSAETFTTSELIVSPTANIIEESILTEVKEEILELPSISSLTPSNIVLKEGSNLHIETKIEPSNDSSMQVEWYHNEKLLLVGHRVTTIHSFGYAVLEMIDISPIDCGTYTCLARNNKGYSQQQFAVSLAPTELATKPRFHYPFKSNLTVRESDSIHVQTILSPKEDKNMAIEWFCDGQPLRPSSRYNTNSDFGYVIFEISRTEPEDSGEYLVVATNKAGVDTNRFTLHCLPTASIVRDTLHTKSLVTIQQLEKSKTHSSVKDESTETGKPKFTRKLIEKIDVIEGQSIHIESQLLPLNDPSMQVVWLRNGTPLIASERFRTINEFGFVILDITACYAEDSGLYEIVAKNDFGEDSIRTVIDCRAKEKVITDSNLPYETIESLQYIDRMMSTTTGETRKEEWRYEAPTFDRPLKDVTDLREGESVHLETRIKPASDPDLTIEWFKDSSPLRASNRLRTIFEFGIVILEINPVQAEDSGVYMLRASNSHGEAVLSSFVSCQSSRNVVYESQILQNSSMYDQKDLVDDRQQQKPQFIDKLKDIHVKENELIHLESRLVPIGDATMQVEWFIDGKPFTTGSRFRTISDFGYVVLEIIEAYARDSGVYECRATNQYGQDSISCHVQIDSAKTVILDTQLPIEYSENIQMLEKRISRAPARLVESEITQPKPRFIGKMEPVIHRNESESVHLECRFEPINDGDLRIEWFVNDRPLTTGSRIHTINDFGLVTLDIDWLFSRDSGVYKCVASNLSGFDSFEVQLNVAAKSNIILDSQFQPQITESKGQQFPAPRFVTPLESKIVFSEGQSVHFETRIEPVGDGELRIEWYHNNQPLKSGHRHKTVYDFGFVSLDIISLTSEDSGTYTCIAKSPRGQDIITSNVEVSSKPMLDFTSQLPKEMSGAIGKIEQIEALPKPEEMVEMKSKNAAPAVVQNLEPLIVLEGEVARFSCRITGYPKPRVIWSLNGNTIVHGSRYKIKYDGIYHLEIPKTRQYDNGKLEVSAKNAFGEAYTSTTLDVRPRNADYRAILKHSPRAYYDDSIGKYQEERKELEMNNVFEERLTAEKGKEVVWYTEKSLEGDRFKIREHLVDYQPVKADATFCMDETAKSTPSTPTTEPKTLGKIKIVSKPKTPQPFQTEITTVPGQDVEKTLTTETTNVCQTSLIGPAVLPETIIHGKEVVVTHQNQIQREITDDTEITRKIHDTKTIEQEHKSATIERKVFGVKPADVSAPKFIKKIQPCRVNEREKARFECEFFGKPEPKVTWFRESYEIQSSDDIRITTINNRSYLVIQEVYLEDSGVFSVQIENEGGTAKCSANLIVEVIKRPSDKVPPNFSKTIQCIRVQEGSVITLDAKINGSRPLKVYWMKNGVRVQEDNKHRLVEHEDQYTLVVLEATIATDAGSYECVAINSVGEARCTAQIMVEESSNEKTKSAEIQPKVIEKLKDITVREGQSAVFKCRIAGHEEVVWYKDDEIIKQSRYFRMTSDQEWQTLRIYEAFSEDEGIYRCCIGKASTSAKLRVIYDNQQEPVLSKLDDVEVVEGTPVQLAYSLSGSPTPRVTWYKDGQPVTLSRDVKTSQTEFSCSLVIRQAFSEDEGQYVCVATNSIGKAERRCYIKIEKRESETLAVDSTEIEKLTDVAPYFSKPLTPTVVQCGDKVELDVVVCAAPKAKLYWFCEKRKIRESHDVRIVEEENALPDSSHQIEVKSRLEIERAHEPDNGKYTVRAINRCGVKSSSVNLLVKGDYKHFFNFFSSSSICAIERAI